MRIKKMVMYTISLPRRRSHRWKNLRGDIGNYVLLKIVDQSGLAGWGEATALGSWGGDYGRYYGETPTTVKTVLQEAIAPGVMDRPFDNYHQILDLSRSSIRGHVYAKTAFQCAVLDLYARSLDLPVYELLGGRRRNSLRIAHSLGLMDPKEAIREARTAVKEGIGTIKVKVGEDLYREKETLLGLYSEFGDTVELAIDANQAWQTASRAEEALKALGELPLTYAEQPVEGLRQMERLSDRVSVPLMADESVWTAHDMADIAVSGRLPYASIYTSKAGGPIEALQMDAIAAAFGIGTNLNGSGETGIGNLANLHTGAAMRSLTEACVLPISQPNWAQTTTVAGRMYTDDVLAEPLEYLDGVLRIPEQPGWGIDVDETKVISVSTAEPVEVGI